MLDEQFGGPMTYGENPEFRPTWRSRTSGWAPSKLGDTLDRFLAQMGAPPVRTLGDLHERWPDIVGPALARRSRPIDVIDGVLTVGCEDPSWASQITWMDGQIKERCATALDGLEILRIAVRVDR